jgi:DNA ligase-1
MKPYEIIQNLEADNSRLAKEAILADAINTAPAEFFDGLKLALDKLVTFGVQKVPKHSGPDGQGLPWIAFLELADSLYKRKLTGHDARDAIELALTVATEAEWNDWYRRILIKDMRAGFDVKTVNKVVKAAKRTEFAIPVFECMLAHDGAGHEKKIIGKKILNPKLDGVRCLTVVNYEAQTVEMYTRNGKLLENFAHVTDYLKGYINEFGRSMVIDGEIMSKSFQDLMKQVHRKDNVEAGDAVLHVFDMLPLAEFKAGKSSLGQRRRLNFIKENFSKIFGDSGCIEIVPWTEIDLDTFIGTVEFTDYNKAMVEAGYEGIMIKDPDAKYECKRTTSWLKQKPFIEVSLTITAVEEGTGRNVDKLGAFVCEGQDDGKTIVVNVGSGFSDANRAEYWESQKEDPATIIGQVVEVRADAVTQNQDGSYSLRFPRFLRFRGFKAGEKI